MKDIKPVPCKDLPPPNNTLVTTIEGSFFPEEAFDYFSRSSGKLTPKPDDTHRKHLKKRTADHIALVNKIVPKSMLKSPRQKRSENIKKKLRNRNGNKCPFDFKEPEIVKE